MPLDVAKLGSALADLFAGKPAFPKDSAEAGEKWAEIYRNYASDALAGLAAPVDDALTEGAGVLAKALALAFASATGASPAPVPVSLPLIDTAFINFWKTPIPFVGPSITGAVTAPSKGSLAGLMTTALAAGLVPGASASLQGAAVAGALDIWTKTVSVKNTSAGGTQDVTLA